MPQALPVTPSPLLRLPKAVGEVYGRYDARLGAWISLRTLDVDLDLGRFHRWQNNPRVAQFWQEAEGRNAGAASRLSAQLADDPHALTLIGCFDYMQRQGFVREKKFDFPHKRATLMNLDWQRFFEQCEGI